MLLGGGLAFARRLLALLLAFEGEVAALLNSHPESFVQLRNQLLCGPLLLQHQSLPLARMLRCLRMVDLAAEV